MTRTSTMSKWIGALAMATTIVACSDRAEREAEQAGNKAANTAEKAGDAVGGAVANAGRAADAAVETMDVKVALTADRRVDASNINVDTDHVTKTVVLKGRVPTADQKKWAQEIATAKAVGYQVRNELTVGGS
jgi:osmotically-inducible protein OsmY